MQEWIKEVLIAFGGGATATISLLLILKSIMTKLVDKTIETSFEKTKIMFTNMIERSTKAYEILLKKEFDFYEKTDSYMASLVPLVQDLVYWAKASQDVTSNDTRENYRSILLKYTQMIPMMKNDVVCFQPYIPTNIFSIYVDLLADMQDDLQYLSFVGKIIFGLEEDIIDANRLNDIRDTILKHVAIFETQVKQRLTELSSNKQ